MDKRSSTLDDGFLWVDSKGEVSYAPVILAVDVSLSCSPVFREHGNTAFIEYSTLPVGGEVLRLKTRFKGLTGFIISAPYQYTKMERDRFEKELQISSAAIIRSWGIGLPKLMNLISQYPTVLPPVAMPAPLVQA